MHLGKSCATCVMQPILTTRTTNEISKMARCCSGMTWRERRRVPSDEFRCKEAANPSWEDLLGAPLLPELEGGLAWGP